MVMAISISTAENLYRPSDPNKESLQPDIVAVKNFEGVLKSNPWTFRQLMRVSWSLLALSNASTWKD